MSDALATGDNAGTTAARLHDAVERSSAVVAGAPSVLRHLLASDDSALFSDAAVAQVRGMIEDLAGQLIGHFAGDGGAERDHSMVGQLATALTADAAFLRHIHAVALEWQLTEALDQGRGADPVLSPLLQALIGSDDGTIAALAMKLLAAQARFRQAQRRMRLPLDELPGELFHGLIVIARNTAERVPLVDLDAKEATLRSGYDEGRSRLGLLSRLAAALGAGVIAALSLSHAGPAIFFSAVAASSGEDRDLLVFAASGRDHLHLALALRASGLGLEAIAEQLLTIDREADPAPDIAGIEREEAAAILSGAR